ncbi:MAG: mechanosensitive ion channel family protein [Treponema sp.]|nr:mechanosensitive ion channel family protein [Treponema sp.]
MEGTIIEEGNTLLHSDNTITEDLNWAYKSFIKWVKGFATWDNFFRLLGVLLIFFALMAVYKLVIRSVKKIPEKKLPAHRSIIILKFIKYVYYAILIMFVLSLFGIKLSAIWGAAGVAGIAIAFAAQTSVSNIISGVFVIVEKTLKIGDLINVAGETGVVDTIGLLSVKVHTLDNQMIRIPNSTIINSTLRNTSYFDKRRLDVKVSVAYNTDMQKALDTLAKAPHLCKCDLQEPAPLVWFDGFDASGINMTLAVWFKKDNFINAKNQTFIAIKRVFDEAGIEIPYNKLDVKVYDSETQFIASRAVAATSKKKTVAAKGKAKSAAKTKRRSKATKEVIESESAKNYDPDDEN